MNRNMILAEIQKQIRDLAGVSEEGERPELAFHLLQDLKDPAPLVLICPGGGYGHTSPREGAPVARAYNAFGYHAAVLHYRLAPDCFPAGLTDLSNGVILLRRYAVELGIDPERIILCGFSAGGHLAASLGVHWDKDYLKNGLRCEDGENRPDAMVLSYPVITSGDFAHKDSIRNLTGESEEEALKDHLSLEKHVSCKTPPVFIWHTMEDPLVPMENALLFVQQLRKKRVPLEFHLFTYGTHGLSLATEEVREDDKERYPDPHIASWHGMSIRWLDSILPASNINNWKKK